MLEKGYNSDIQYNGLSYHVQTEDWGPSNPFVVSKVFCQGAVLRSFKTPYTNFLSKINKPEREAVREALRRQHTKILDLLVAGKLL